MKKHFLLMLFAFLTVAGYAQQPVGAHKVILHDHYSISGGIMGGANFSNLSLSGHDGVEALEYDTKLGWLAGAFLNIPLGKVLSLEGQYNYNTYAMNAKDALATSFVDGFAGYHSIPVQLKVHIGKPLALTLGAQFDFLDDVTDENNILNKSAFKESSTNVIGGIEIFPRGRLTIFGRYVLGLGDLDARELPNNDIDYKLRSLQAGLKLRLFGGMVYADRDGDGIKDKDDKCPDVAGLERYEGCPIPDTDGDGFNDEVDKCPTQRGVAEYDGCPIPDRDKDGVNDADDQCPDVAGVAKYNGCPIPDTDGDGVNDDDDRCPNQKGLAKYNGCPIPDTDGDGVNDEEDKCPNEKGVARYGGCPIPDTDGDGINDEEDRCPTVKGVASMRGCPAIEKFEAHEVTFSSGSSTLTSKGKAELDLVVAYLKGNADLKVSLDGHTDNTGSDKVNDELSAKRALAALNYIASKGISKDRLMSKGHGSKMPVADNSTADGRQKNRRVEITVN